MASHDEVVLEEAISREEGKEGDGDSESDEPDGSEPSRGRGRPKIPVYWTRVIKVDEAELEELQKFQLATDLLMEDQEPQLTRRQRQQPWSMHFEPKQWRQEHPLQTMENSRLSTDLMLKHGKTLTKIR